MWHDYDYAFLRLVPDVTGEAFTNVGLVLHSRTARYLGLRVCFDPGTPLRDGLDGALVARYLAGMQRVAEGGAAGGPIGLLPPSERFHWLTAVRSTVLQPGPVRGGRTPDVAATFAALCRDYGM
jgi:hypothetical protein